MSRWPIGFSTGCFYRQRIFECLGPIRARGFQVLEISSAITHFDYRNPEEVRKVGEAIRQLGFKVQSVHAPYAPELDISSPDMGVREASAQLLFQAATAAGELEAGMLVVHPGPERSFHPPGEERHQRLSHSVSVLSRVAEVCHIAGVRMVLENMLPLLLFGNTGDMLHMLEALEGHAGVCLDTGHGFLTGNIFHVVSRLASYIQMLHVHDNHGRLDDHFPPGQGHIHWVKLFQELHKIGFHGSLIMELIQPPDKTMEGILDAAWAAGEYLRKLEAEM